MSWHLLCNYSASVPNNSTNVTLGAPLDQAIGLSNGRYQMPANMRTIAVAGAVPDVLNVRLNVPSQRALGYPSFDPVAGAVPPTSRQPIIVFPDGGPTIMQSEELAVEVSRGGAANAQAYVLMALADAPQPQTATNSFTVRATSTVAVVAGQWSLGSMVLDQTLVAGVYDVTGLSSYGTGVIASRLSFVGSVLRPGAPARQVQGEYNGDQFRRGAMGKYGSFNSFALPQIEFFGIAAGATQVTFLDLQKRS